MNGFLLPSFLSATSIDRRARPRPFGRRPPSGGRRAKTAATREQIEKSQVLQGGDLKNPLENQLQFPLDYSTVRKGLFSAGIGVLIQLSKKSA